MYLENCFFPEDVLYEVNENVWIKIVGEEVILGINSILAWFSGKFTSVRYIGKGLLEKGAIICAVESIRRFDVIRAPFRCELLKINEEIVERPIILNKDPYGKGWIAKLLPKEDISSLKFERMERVKEALSQRIKELRVRCFSEFPDYEFFEIGVECSVVLTKLNEFFSKAEVGTVVHIVSDDPTSPIEMMRWEEQTGQKFVEYRKEDNLFHLIAKKIR